jgi:hypothetical protein
MTEPTLTNSNSHGACELGLRWLRTREVECGEFKSGCTFEHKEVCYNAGSNCLHGADKYLSRILNKTTKQNLAHPNIGTGQSVGKVGIRQVFLSPTTRISPHLLRRPGAVTCSK